MIQGDFCIHVSICFSLKAAEEEEEAMYETMLEQAPQGIFSF